MSFVIPNDELRVHPRYVAEPALDGFFGDVAVVLVNISVAGALVRHSDPIGELKERALCLGGGFSSLVTLHAEVIWTRTVRASNGAGYESGLRFIQWIEVAQGLIDRLVDRSAVRLDTSRPPSRHAGRIE
jgi:hypothetical protein